MKHLNTNDFKFSFQGDQGKQGIAGPQGFNGYEVRFSIVLQLLWYPNNFACIHVSCFYNYC